MRLADVVGDREDARLPDLARDALALIIEQLRAAIERIAALKPEIMRWHRGNPVSQLLAGIPDIGPVTATAIAATVPDASAFQSGRQFSAWLGLTPRQHSSGGKQRLGGISKRGDGYLRRLLVTGATAALERSKSTRAHPWVQGIGRLPLLNNLSAKTEITVVNFRATPHDHGKIINFSLGSIRSCANH